MDNQSELDEKVMQVITELLFQANRQQFFIGAFLGLPGSGKFLLQIDFTQPMLQLRDAYFASLSIRLFIELMLVAAILIAMLEYFLARLNYEKFLKICSNFVVTYDDACFYRDDRTTNLHEERVVGPCTPASTFSKFVAAQVRRERCL